MHVSFPHFSSDSCTCIALVYLLPMLRLLDSMLSSASLAARSKSFLLATFSFQLCRVYTYPECSATHDLQYISRPHTNLHTMQIVVVLVAKKGLILLEGLNKTCGLQQTMQLDPIGNLLQSSLPISQAA